MSMSDAVSTGALLMIGLIFLVLLMQYLRLHEIWHLLLGNQKAARWARIREMESRELRSALRAEKAHVEQLQRKLEILLAMVPVA